MNIKTLSITTALLITASFLHAEGSSGIEMQAGEPANMATAHQSGTATPLAVSGTDDYIVFKLAGDGQTAPAGQWTPASLEVGTWKETGPAPLMNVSVDFSLVEGGGWLARAPGVDAGASVQILTDIDGIAQVWHRQPDQANVQSIITASALGKSVTFTTYSILPSDATASVQAAGTSPLTAETQAGTLSQSGTETPAGRLSQKSLLMSLATAQGTRRSGSKSVQRDAASKTAGEPATSGASILADEYFSYPASHPVGRMQRGMVLYAAAGKARELRDTEQAVLLAAESKEWLLLALENESELSSSVASRCHYYLGKISERYNGNQSAALQHYRAAGEKDAIRKQAKAAANRIERFKK